jgi:ABC-type bacteriocin/lantibiotic exporter with double-glycine peptidase domain
MVRRAWLLLLCLFPAGSGFAQAPAGVWLDVPFVQQPRDGCGAASISMVMQYWAVQEHRDAGDIGDVSHIQRLLYSPKDHGIRASDMVDYFTRHRFQAFAFSGQWADLEQHLSKGRPLIAALKPEGQSQLHYVVIDGIDPVHALVMMNDPAQRKVLTEERAVFEKDWSATHNWVLLAVPAPFRQ